MRRIMLSVVIFVCSIFIISVPSYATIMYADHVTNILRGDATIGDFPGFYGGNFPGAYPVPLTQAQAEASVLGVADGAFLSLPGRNDTLSGSGFPYAYVEVGFATNFSVNDKIVITELGDNSESAQLWIWAVDGGNAQLQITRGVSDTIIVDLSPWAGIFTDFYKIGIGGLDLLGASQGFDLDAVGVERVPEPSTLLLFGSGLLGFGFFARKRIKG